MTLSRQLMGWDRKHFCQGSPWAGCAQKENCPQPSRSQARATIHHADHPQTLRSEAIFGGSPSSVSKKADSSALHCDSLFPCFNCNECSFNHHRRTPIEALEKPHINFGDSFD